MRSLDNKGFTLIELLATISILAIIMLMAVPNVIGIVQRSRNKTYIEDAKKMVALAQYKIRIDSTAKPSNGQTACLYLNYLDASKEITDAPNGGKYVKDLSYVKVTKTGNKFTYSVQLIETKDGNKASGNGQVYSEYAGLIEKSEDDLYKDNIVKEVKNSGVAATECSGDVNK